MDLGIKDKVALITGSGGGLGRIVALQLAQEGCKIVIADVRKEGVDKVVEEIKGLNVEVIGFQCDITKTDQIEAMLAEITAKWKAVDILVNNAAVLDNMAPIEKMKDNLWLRDIAVNLTGTYYITKACFTAMKAQKWGRIVTMSSVAGALGGFGQASYSASKSGVIGLMRTVALEGGRYNITANSIVGGIIATEIYPTIRADMRERLEKRTVFMRPGKPAEIADSIVFLCSERASYVTGTEMYLTGGIHLFTF
ncbi:MAG: SDR family oxidoreductase [Proteobacteria bacterium]|nr:SDR family oxidoreductase [Pseudomonadota bacterium]